MEWGMLDLLKSTTQERYDKILAWIDAFDEANRHRDHDGWMARSVASSRALFLWEAERYEESLIACDIVEQLGFEDAWCRFAARSARARRH